MLLGDVGQTGLSESPPGTFLTIGLGGYFYHRGQLADIAAEHLRLLVTGPAKLEAGRSCRFLVRTTTVTGHPVPGQIEFSLFTPGGKQLIAYKELVGDDGTVQIAVSADLLAPPEVRLEVVGVYRARTERVETRLAVVPSRFLTALCVSNVGFRPGETIRWRSLTVSRCQLTPASAIPIRYAIHAADGTEVPGTSREGTTVHGVGCGEFVIPPSGFAAGTYTLVARSPGGQFSEVRHPFHVGADGTVKTKATATPNVSPSSEAAGKIDVVFCPEGGELVADLENRVYFAARDATGSPVRISGKILDSQGQTVIAVESLDGSDKRAVTKKTAPGSSGPLDHGFGSFSLQPRATEQYRLKIENPPGVVGEIRLPSVSADHGVVLTTGGGIVEAGKPLEFSLHAIASDMPLVAVVSSGDVQVGQQMLVTSVGVNSVTIPLEDGLAGVFRLAIYEYRTERPSLLAERLIFRRPRHPLQLRVASAKQTYQPGDRAELTLGVSDEQGKATSADVSVSVVRDHDPTDAAAKLPSAVAQLLLDGGDAGDDLDSLLPSDARTAAALDCYLAIRSRSSAGDAVGLPTNRSNAPATPELAVSAPVMFDNLGRLEQQYRENLTSYHANRTRVLNTLTTLSFFGGVGLVVFVGMLSLLSIPCGLRLWGPSLAVAATCIVIGAILMDPGRLKPNQVGAVAFASHEAMPKAIAAPALSQASPSGKPAALRAFPTTGYEYRRKEKSPSGGKAVGPALLWLPLKSIDGKGQASIPLEFPDSPGRYRVLVETITESGRVGTAAMQLQCEKGGKH